MLTLISILWIAGLSFTVWERHRRIKRIEHKLNKYLYEQTRKEAKKAEKEGSKRDPS